MYYLKPYICNFRICSSINRDKIFFRNKLRGFSPQANYTDRATAACRLI
jgi:hypothetical protein